MNIKKFTRNFNINFKIAFYNVENKMIPANSYTGGFFVMLLFFTLCLPYEIVRYSVHLYL